jgi:hypothetical protein
VVDVDGLAYPLHRPTACSRQLRGHGFLSGVVWSHRAAMDGGALPRDARPPGLDICWCVDCLGTYVIEFYMECIAFTRTCLPCARVTMVCMRVSMIELPFQIVMRRITSLEYILSSACGLQQLRSISSGNDFYRPWGLDADRAYSVTESPWWGDQMSGSLPGRGRRGMSYPIFMPKPSTHRMHDPGSIVPHM